MRSLQFLVSRRWVFFLLAVVLLSWLAWVLGQWQFHRLEERQQRNEAITRNLDREPVPVSSVLSVGEDVPPDERWRRVVASGRYDAENRIVVRYRTREGESGVEVVVPLVTDEGPTLLVDRGWLPSENRGVPEEVPTPSEEPVTVTGFVRADADPDDTGTDVTDLSTRAISSEAIGEAIGQDTYGGFVILEDEEPEVAPEAPRLEPVEMPELDEGPHFFYGLQWWFFGALAVFGFGYLAYDEWRRARRPEDRRRRPEDEPVTGS